MTTRNNNGPTHRLFAVTKTAKGKKFWQPIGALFQNHDGKGFNLSLDYLPLNNADLVAREISDEPQAEATEGGAQ
jgi:hypothetical protein